MLSGISVALRKERFSDGMYRFGIDGPNPFQVALKRFGLSHEHSTGIDIRSLRVADPVTTLVTFAAAGI